MSRFFIAAILLIPSFSSSYCAEPKALKLLFLGDNGHHKPADRFIQVQALLAKRGIDLTYTDRVEALAPRRSLRTTA